MYDMAIVGVLPCERCQEAFGQRPRWLCGRMQGSDIPQSGAPTRRMEDAPGLGLPRRPGRISVGPSEVSRRRVLYLCYDIRVVRGGVATTTACLQADTSPPGAAGGNARTWTATREEPSRSKLLLPLAMADVICRERQRGALRAPGAYGASLGALGEIRRPTTMSARRGEAGGDAGPGTFAGRRTIRAPG